MILQIKRNIPGIAVLLVSLLIQLAICKGETFAISDSTVRVQELRIDLHSAKTGDGMSLVDSIKYIPLETNNESEFSTISQLEITEKYYIILDKRLNTLLFFNRNGSFYRKISKNSKDIPTPFKSLGRFAVDTSRNILLVDDYGSSNLYEFNLNGDFSHIVNKKMAATDYTFFKDLKVCYHLEISPAMNDSGAYITIYNAATEEKRDSYLFSNSAQHNLDAIDIPNHFYRSDGGQVFFTHPFDYTIYELDTNGLPQGRYKIILPLSNTLPTDFLIDPTLNGKRRDYITSNKSIIYSLRNVYISGDWLSFYTMNSVQGSTFLYNLATGNLYNLKETKDPLIGLPITEWLAPILGVNQGALISAIPFLSLKKKYEEIPKSQRNGFFPEELTALMNRKSHNFILRLSYFKQ